MRTVLMDETEARLLSGTLRLARSYEVSTAGPPPGGVSPSGGAIDELAERLSRTNGEVRLSEAELEYLWDALHFAYRKASAVWARIERAEVQ